VDVVDGDHDERVPPWAHVPLLSTTTTTVVEEPGRRSLGFRNPPADVDA
jgi:hypothetical protein